MIVLALYPPITWNHLESESREKSYMAGARVITQDLYIYTLQY